MQGARRFLAGFAGANPPFGTPIADAIYMFFIPKNTVFNSGGSNCCSDFYGYHDETTINGQNVPYAIVCSCDGSQDNPPVSDLNDIMVTASHEAVESATDPYFNQGVAYGQTDDNDAAWSIFTDGEVADMCEYRTDEDIAAAPATGLVQRSWSNAAASAGHDPCVPQPAGEVYFNSAPVLSDSVSIFDFNGNPWPTKGVKIAVGSSVTIPVKLWSEAPTSGDWTVAAYDYNDYVGGQANLTFTWDRTTGHNGDTLNLTIHVVSHNNNLGGELFMIDSTLGTVDSESIGAVGQ